MNAIGEILAIATIAFAAAGGTFLVSGPPSRSVQCDPATLKPDEICLQQIVWDEPTLWVDARHRKDWEKNGLPGSALWNLDVGEDMQAFEAEIATRILETPRVIVYCGDENCGLSRQVADRIRSLGLASEVLVLHGGWRALSEAGRVKDSSPGS
ncbi:MAG: rhodanese-like domain-containing protein [Verrucomicrobiota bacterium]